MPKNKRSVFPLGAAYIEIVHDELVSGLFPGAEPVGREEFRDRGLLSSAAARPFQTAGGVEIFGTLEDKAAALFHSLIANHPFHNGNKRTAIIALDHFLLANDCFLLATPEQMYVLAKATALYRERGISHDQILSKIVKIIRSRVIPLENLEGRAGVTELYENALRGRREIRRNKLNREQLL